LKTFSKEEKDKLMEYIIKEDNFTLTALHIASLNGHENMVQLVLTTFSEEEKEKLMEYVRIVNLLLNTFSKEKEKSIEYVLKENIQNRTALHLAEEQKHVEIVKLLQNCIESKIKIF
jgi:ankyrin repeat protein